MIDSTASRGSATARFGINPGAIRALRWVLSFAAILSPASTLAQAPTSQPTTSPAPASPPAATAPAQPAPSPAATDGLDDIELLDLRVPVVVTATRRPQPVDTVPYAVSVITADDIRRAGARNVPEALRLAPGIDVAALSYGNYAVSPRGFHGFLADQALVLVDGRQLFDSLFGGTAWGIWPFQVEDIERIEVVRGPGGVTWGANAVNGVINIITKKPADQAGLTITGGGGSRGTHNEHLGYAFADDKLQLRISGEFENSDGFRSGRRGFLHGYEDEYHAGRLAVHGIFDVSPRDTLTFSAGSAITDDNLPRGLVSGPQRKNVSFQANYVLGRWTHEIEPDNHIDVAAYVNDHYASPGMSRLEYRYQQLAFQFSHTFKPAPAHTLTWGLDTRVDLLDTSIADPYMLAEDYLSTAVVGLYVQDDWRLAPRWLLSLGARIDYESYGGFQPSGRAALAYELNENSRVYAAVSRAFQMPAVGVRFLEMPFYWGLAHLVSDEHVNTQDLLAYELGYRAQLFDRLDLDLNTFWHEHQDLVGLTPRPGPPGLLAVEYDNLADASIYGVELEARYALTERVTLLGNYTFQNLNWRSGEAPSVLCRDNPEPPKHKFMLGARWGLTDDLHLASHLYYVDATTAPNGAWPLSPLTIHPYFRLDLRGEYEFWNDRAALAVGVRDLLDGAHYEGGTMFLGPGEVPRMIYAELRIRYK